MPTSSRGCKVIVTKGCSNGSVGVFKKKVAIGRHMVFVYQNVCYIYQGGTPWCKTPTLSSAKAMINNYEVAVKDSSNRVKDMFGDLMVIPIEEV
uniref:Uncharacterized protein n=1 Tax=Pseudomonas phage vB_PaeP_HTN1 TaxID=3236646 RepID=A0AB39AI34_9VIRU